MDADANAFPEKAWYSYKGGVYAGKLPAYFERSDFPWAEKSEAEFETLRASVENYLSQLQGGMQPYFFGAHTSKAESWKLEPFFYWGERIASSCDAAPEAERFFRSIPGMVSASVSLLQPGTRIAPHYGDTNTVVRCHMGLRVPAGLPECGIEVNGGQREWQEGKWLFFCDAHLHSVWNLTDQPRYIIIMDVLHPAFQSQKKNVCTNGMSLMRMQRLDLKYPFLKKLPGVVRGGIRHLLKYGFYLGLLKPRK